MRFRMKKHAVRCVFALWIHLNVCVLIKKRISVNATIESKIYMIVLNVFCDSECDTRGQVGQKRQFQRDVIIEHPHY